MAYEVVIDYSRESGDGRTSAGLRHARDHRTFHEVTFIVVCGLQRAPMSSDITVQIRKPEGASDRCKDKEAKVIKLTDTGRFHDRIIHAYGVWRNACVADTRVEKGYATQTFSHATQIKVNKGVTAYGRICILP